mmetsp:Transcript_29253/g.56693  ORF Transcript_29253/g.56693 Transcript_29253/m.56693 type:complete len:205 (+) Transcript_29253:4031-4645(+)
MRKGQYDQGDRSHGNARKAGRDELLTPGQQHERDGRTEPTDGGQRQHCARTRRIGKKLAAQSAPNGCHQHGCKPDAPGGQPERRDALQRDLGHQKGAAPGEAERCNHQPTERRDLGRGWCGHEGKTDQDAEVPSHLAGGVWNAIPDARVSLVRHEKGRALLARPSKSFCEDAISSSTCRPSCLRKSTASCRAASRPFLRSGARH